MPKVFDVSMAWYDGWTTAAARVVAETREEACQKAIELADEGKVPNHRRSWDPTATFVVSLSEPEADPAAEHDPAEAEWDFDGDDQPVPDDFTEVGTLHRALVVKL